MIQQQVTIINKLGLHARAAAKFVSCATAFSSDIKVGLPGNPRSNAETHRSLVGSSVTAMPASA